MFESPFLRRPLILRVTTLPLIQAEGVSDRTQGETLSFVVESWQSLHRTDCNCICFLMFNLIVVVVAPRIVISLNFNNSGHPFVNFKLRVSDKLIIVRLYIYLNNRIENIKSLLLINLSD